MNNKIRSDRGVLRNASICTFFIFVAFLGLLCKMGDDNEGYFKLRYSIDDSKLLDFTDYPELIQYTTLKSNPNDFVDISSIWRIFFNEGLITIIENNSDVTIRVFNKSDGVEKSTYEIPDQGPEGIKSVTDAWYTSSGVEILDFSTSNIFYLNFDSGDLKVEYEIPQGFNEGATLDNISFLLYADNSPNDLGEYNLNLVNLENKNLLDQDDKIQNFHSGIGLERRPFFYMEDQLFYYPPVGTEIYSINDKGISKIIDLYSNIGLQENGKIQSVNDFLTIRRQQDFITCFDYVYGHKDKVFSQFRYKREFYWMLIDIKTGEFRIIKPFLPFVDEMKITYQPRGIDENGNIYFIAYTHDIINYLNNSSAGPFKEDLESKVVGVGSDEDPILVHLNIKNLYSLDLF